MERDTDTNGDFVHLVSDGIVCSTEDRGKMTPGGRSPHELVVDATEGFIPLWYEGTILRWRFQERSFRRASDPEASKAAVVEIMSEALLRWRPAAPVKFTQNTDLWDFEFVLRNAPDCSAVGCVLASAFFPDAGRHQLTIYPTMFEQSAEEQIETLIHEFGHVFGLRHFFANIGERQWPSQIFGTHNPFSIMNYGAKSVLTDADLTDLKELYRLAWSGELTQINETPIRLVRPFSAGAPAILPVATAAILGPGSAALRGVSSVGQ